MISKSQRKDLARRTRIYWAIGLQLITSSTAFRLALINKVMGKVGKWYHRDVELQELFRVNRSYLSIVSGWKQVIPVQRK